MKKSRRYLNIEVHGVNLLKPESISAGIKEADTKGHDVIVITRGGGPDLYLFNDQAIVAAVQACKTFTITGLGHANYETECDRVSDSSVGDLAGGSVSAFKLFLKIARRVVLASLFILAGILVLLIFSLLLRGC